MIKKYRKLPVEIEAIQFDGTHECAEKIIKWAKNDDIITGLGWDNELILRIKTLEGMMGANENDWIIKGVNGEFYPCKPDIFDLTYEPVETINTD